MGTRVNAGGVELGRSRTGRVVLLLFSAVLGGVLLVIALSLRHPPEIEVLSPDVKLESKQPLPDRWIPKGWGWARRLKTSLFGKVKWAWIEPHLLSVDAGF